MSVCIVSFSTGENGNCGRIGEYIRSFHAGPIKYFDFSRLAVELAGRAPFSKSALPASFVTISS